MYCRYIKIKEIRRIHSYSWAGIQLKRDTIKKDTLVQRYEIFVRSGKETV